MKVVINRCHGGFGLSDKAHEFFASKGVCSRGGFNIDRSNPVLVECVEKLGAMASGLHAELEVISIPDNVEYQIEGYGGLEHVAECHRIWS